MQFALCGLNTYQITIDGKQDLHNKVRYNNSIKDSFSTICHNIIRLLNIIPEADITLRYNYTASNLDLQIVDDINRQFPEEYRSRIKFFPRKVWQEDENDIPEDVYRALCDKIISSGYSIELSHDIFSGICYAEKKHFNSIFQNGRVDKCSNIGLSQTRGSLDTDGNIVWDEDLIEYGGAQFLDNELCRECKFLPLCNGFCPVHRRKDKEEGKPKSCSLSNNVKYYKALLAIPQNLISMIKEKFALAALLCLMAGSTVDLSAQSAMTEIVDTLARSVVVASRVSRQSDRDTYMVLRKNVDQSFDAYSLLEQIPTVKYDRIGSAITVNGSDRIAYVAGGRELSKEEVDALRPDQVKSISIIHTPSGRFLSRGIRYVVEFRLRTESGISATVGNNIRISPGNGDNIVSAEQPNINLQYSHNKLDINTGYAFGTYNWNYHSTLERTLPNGTTYSSCGSSDPTEVIKNRQHVAYLRGTYNFNDKQSFSVYSSFSQMDGRNRINNLLTETGSGVLFDETIDNNKVSNDWKVGAVYNANLSDRWQMNISANWNRIGSALDYSYISGNAGNESMLQDNVKNYSFQNIDFTFLASERMSLNFGANGTYNDYNVRMRNGGSVLMDRTSGRFDVYAYATWNVLDNLALFGGLSAGFVKDYGETRGFVAPMVSLSYYPGAAFALNASYTMSPSYPTQDDLNPTLYKKGEFLYGQGNPDLPINIRSHQFMLQLSFWDNLVFTNFTSYDPNGISDLYLRDGDNVIATLTDAKNLTNITGVDYNWQISRNWSWNNSIQMNYFRISRPGMKNFDIEVNGESSLRYFWPKKMLTAQATYQRSMNRTPTLQGFEDFGMDLFNISLNKYLFNNNMVLSVDYTLPMGIGTRKAQCSEVVTPFFTQKSRFNLGVYDNMVRVRLVWRLSNGRRTRNIQDNTRYDNESAKGRGLE